MSAAADQVTAVKPRSLKDPANFINRELSQLQFNKRVLAQAQDSSIPLLERVRFLCISCTNLDEFFEVRVAAIRQRLNFGADAPGPDGLSPRQTLDQIRQQTLQIVDAQYRTLNQVILPALQQEGVRFLRRENWTARQTRWLESYFQRELKPVLSPLGLDPVHPFPRILNKSLNFAVQLDGKDAFGREGEMALVRAPRSLPRIIQVPKSYAGAPYDFVFLSSVLQAFMERLFPGMEVIGSHQFRVTRNSELFVDEEEIEDLARALQGELLERGFAEAVRLELGLECPENVEKFLVSKFGVGEQDVYHCDGPVNLNRLMAVHSMVDRADLKYLPFQPRVQRPLLTSANLFEAIRRHDCLLHHPYDGFGTVVELVKQACRDDDVLAIKMTLYRTATDTALVNLLVEAAHSGKDVTVVVELRARFDEATNIGLAARLQEAGVQVVYGIVGHKTHAKMLLIVRRERGRIRRYVHLGTGNYHEETAKAYTDFSLLTDRPAFGEDVHNVFQQLSGLGRVLKMQELLHSPFTLHKAMLAKIKREVKLAKAGKTAKVHAKMNQLTEPKVIRALYQASQAGVEVKLVVRGQCCLRPGVPGLSENIEVRSILGRFLEHARVYYFHNDGDSELFCSSADWMERNLFQRVEVAFPLMIPAMAERVYREALGLALKDNTEHWALHEDGEYTLVNGREDGKTKHLQERLLREITG